MEVGQTVTFSSWLPHSHVGKIVEQDTNDHNFFKVKCKDGKERWYHRDSLQAHVPKVNTDRPWEAYQVRK